MARERRAAHAGQTGRGHGFFDGFRRQLRAGAFLERQRILLVRLDLDGRHNAPQRVAGGVEFYDRPVDRAVHRSGNEPARLPYHLSPGNMVALRHHGLARRADMLGKGHQKRLRKRHGRYRSVGGYELVVRRMNAALECEDFHTNK